MKWRDRSATDLAVLGILLIVGFVLCVSIVGIFVIKIIQPDTDVGQILEVESEILAILVGALVGFVGGRSVGHREAEDEQREE